MGAIIGGARLGGAYTPFRGKRRTVHPQAQHVEEQVSKQLPERSIRLGEHLHSETGEVIGEAWLPLPTRLYKTKEAICVEGKTGAGKTVFMRLLAEYFAKEEGRCVIIFDITKNQYNRNSFSNPQNDPEMLEKLEEVGIAPTTLTDVEVYSPIYDIPRVGEETMRRDFNMTKPLSIRTEGLTPAGFFELGDIDPSGRVYKLYLDAILNVPTGQKTANYIETELERRMSDPTLKRSIISLINLFRPLREQGIIRDDGTDVREMLHAPRGNGRAGKISVINLITTEANDNRKNALVAAVINQIFNIIKNDRAIRPVIMSDEVKFIAPRNASDSPATYGIMSSMFNLSRAWGATEIYGFQDREDVAEYILQAPYFIQLKPTMTFGNGTKVTGKGYGLLHISNTGDKELQEWEGHPQWMHTYPCRTRHID